MEGVENALEFQDAGTSLPETETEAPLADTGREKGRFFKRLRSVFTNHESS